MKRKLSGIHKTQWGFADHDYLDDLSEEEFEWLQKFDREYYSAIVTENPIHEDETEIKREAWARQKAARDDVWKENRRAKGSASNKPAKTSTSELDVEELHDLLGPEGAREELKIRLIEALEHSKGNHREVIIERFMNDYHRLREIYRKEHYTRNTSGKNTNGKKRRRKK